MIGHIWNIVLYQPLLNALAFLVSIIPRGDVGIAGIVLTLLVKVILFPLSRKSIESQAQMNILTPELNKIKASGASKEEQAKLTFELYKQHKTNPFSGCLLLLIQIPIILALYYVFSKGIKFDSVLFYPFVHIPSHINMVFLGFLDLTKRSFILAVVAGLSQYLQAYYMPKPPVPVSGASASLSDSFAKSMNMQMKYVFPFIIAFIALSISGAVVLYWITSNLFMVGQQIYIKKKEFSVVTK